MLDSLESHQGHQGVSCFSVFYKMKFGIFVEIIIQ